MSEPRRTILVNVDHIFALRNVVATPLIKAMANRDDLHWTLCSRLPSKFDERAVHELIPGTSNILHEPSLPRDRGGPEERAFLGKQRSLDRFLLSARILKIHRFLHLSLTYRFNAVNHLAAYDNRIKRSPERKKMDYALSSFGPPRLGFPYPRNQTILNMLNRFYETRFPAPSLNWLEFLDDTYNFSVILLGQSQHYATLPFVRLAEKRGIPLVGVCQSWDQPTTKGPFPANIDFHISGCDFMTDMMVKFHGIDRNRIKTLGYPFFEAQESDQSRPSREDFLKSLDLAPDMKIIAFCANTLAFGAHEPGIAKHCVRAMTEGRYGDKVAIVIRTHPQEPKSDSFTCLALMPGTEGRLKVLAPELDDVYGRKDHEFYKNLMTFSSVVVNTGSSVCLDAVAFDTPAIFLAFDGDIQVQIPEDRVETLYQAEHLHAITTLGGIRLARGYSELDDDIIQYLENPSRDASERRETRSRFLGPLDSPVSRNIVETCARFASRDFTEDEKVLLDRKFRDPRTVNEDQLKRRFRERLATHTPKPPATSLPTLFNAFLVHHVTRTLRRIEGDFYLFGAGKHSEWILSLVPETAGKIKAVLDDNAKNNAQLSGIPVVSPNDVTLGATDTVVFSTDCHQKIFRSRCEALWGSDVQMVDLYDGLPPGPYPKT